MKLRLSTTAALFALTGAAVVSHSFAQDAADIDNAIQNHICPAAKIDTRQLPNFEPCKALEPQWSKVDACQNEAQHYANLAYEYNKIYVDCHKDAASTSSAKPSGGVPGKDGRRVESGTSPVVTSAGQTDYAAAERARQRSEFDLAQKMDSMEGWRAFLKEYPDGVDAEWAKKRIAELSAGTSSESRTGRPSTSPRLSPLENAKILGTIVNTRRGRSFPLSLDVAGSELTITADGYTLPCGLDATREIDVGPSTQSGWTSRLLRCSFSRTADGINMVRTASFTGAVQGQYVRQRQILNITLANGGCKVSGKIESDQNGVPEGARMTRENVRRITESTDLLGTCHIESH